MATKIKFKKVNALPASPTAADDGVYFVKAGAKYRLSVISAGVVFSWDAVSATLSEDVNGVKNFVSSPTVPTATTAQQAINKGQLDSAINTINTQLAAGLRTPVGLDCSGNPNTPANAKKGDTWLVTKAGKFGGASGIAVQVGDMIICTADTPTSGTTTTNFFVVESNLQASTETVAGYIRIATSSEATAGTDNTTALTPAKGKTLAENRINALAVLLTGNQTIAGVKTFSSSPVVPTATANNQAVNLGQVNTAISNAELQWGAEEW
jgi:hypothetical protein